MRRLGLGLVLAIVLVALPAPTLAYTCTRQPLAQSYTVKLTQPFNAGVYPRGIHATTDNRPTPIVYSGTVSTAGIWIDSTPTNGSAWIGIYRSPTTSWGRMYYKNASGSMILDQTFTLYAGTAQRPFDILLATAAGNDVEFWYGGTQIAAFDTSGTWHSQAGTVGVTTGIANRASMMWGWAGELYAFKELGYWSQHGSGWFTSSAFVTNSNTTYFDGDILPFGAPLFLVQDRNCQY